MSEAIKLRASHPEFKKIDTLQRLLLRAMNPQMFFSFEVDVPEVERRATVAMIKADIEKEIDRFLPSGIANHINKLEEEMGNDR